MANVTIKRALISVSDKTGLAELGHALTARGVSLVSTGGTAEALRNAGLMVLDVAELTGFPEMMDGRVKTLHPKIHGGLLAVRDNPSHAAAMVKYEIGAIDVVIVNLYPFEATVANGASRDVVVENIDIGGPSMVRSAAKNHAYVTVLTDPADYPIFLTELEANKGTTTSAFRSAMAAKAFSVTAAYDAAIAQWFTQVDQPTKFPPLYFMPSRLITTLRYGENPHQGAALYVPTGPAVSGIAQAVQVQGKELSYNNYNDANAALELVAELGTTQPTVVIVKHANPCGVATAGSLLEAWEDALACDSVSAFGGIVAVNQALDGPTARAIAEIFTEVVVAPGADVEAREVFARKKNLRLLLIDGLPDPHRGGQMVTVVAGGVLMQDRDNGQVTPEMLRCVTKRQPSSQELQDCLFAWTVAKHVKSNAIVYAKDGATAGIGAGQMNRRDSARIASAKALEAAKTNGWAKPRTIGAVVASDAFFPFADGLLAAIEAGATAVIQPGGSIRDSEVIKAADKANLAMLFTGMRHFRH